VLNGKIAPPLAASSPELRFSVAMPTKSTLCETAIPR
jgi:hypothetical protein